jgi:hypothetical protein
MSFSRAIGLACVAAAVSCGGGGGGGSSGGLVLEEIRWGRLVEVRDAADVMLHPEFLVAEGISTDLLDYEMTTLPVTGGTVLRILPAPGTPAYDAALAALETGLGFVAAKGPDSPPPYSMVPRNAAVRLRFNQPVNPATVTAQNLRVLSGGVSLEVRLEVDPEDRRAILIDPVISAAEGAASGLAVNALGFPAAATAVVPNLELRIPTRRDPSAGQNTLLRAASGSSLEDDDADDGADLVRVFRSGGTDTADPNRGFLTDYIPPALIGVQPVSICAVAPGPGGRQAVSFGYLVGSCAIAPERGDVIEQGETLALVVSVLATISSCGPPVFSVAEVLVEPLRAGGGGALLPLETGGASIHLRFKPAGEDPPACFVRFVPEPLAPPAGGIDPAAVARLRFSEPMDPATLGAFDGLTMTTVDPDLAGIPAPRDFVVGEVAPSVDLQEFAFVPALPIPHAAGAGEPRYLNLASGAAGPTDLAGNPVAGSGISLLFTIDPSAPAANMGGFALRFGSVNETSFDLGPPDLGGDPPVPEGGMPDVSGQVVLSPGELRGRGVLRFSRAADPGNLFVGAAPVVYPFPLITPLTSWGSRLLTLWRHVDLGLGGQEVGEINLDVERLAWAPFQSGEDPQGPPVFPNLLPRVRIDLAHAYYFPDEAINPGTLLPQWPDSGLDPAKFQPTIPPTATNPGGEISNVFAYHRWNPAANGGLGGVEVNPPLTVFDGPYAINPLDLFAVPESGFLMLPYPSFTQTYTWRDTGYPFRRKGAPGGDGVEPERWLTVLGAPRPRLYAAGQVPSVCLPLLLQIRSYPQADAGPFATVNQLQVSLMVNSSLNPQLAPPFFRIFSTGGFNAASNLVLKDPELNVPNGGFNTGGQPTVPAGPELYWGRADFVTRVTRCFTHWFDLGAGSPGGPTFVPPLIEPRAEGQPAGTSVKVEFRGASGVAGSCQGPAPACPELNDASAANVYGIYLQSLLGEPPNQAPTTRITGVAPPFVTGPQATVLDEWTDDLTRLNGRRYLQVRFTFLSNRTTGEVPRISSLGVAYAR